MGYVTVEAAQVLQEMGYPQDGWPQFVWQRSFRPKKQDWSEWNCVYDESPAPEWYHGGDDGNGNPPDQELAVCDELTALLWLEQERGYGWERFRGHVNEPPLWMAVGDNKMIVPLMADTPSALIVAIGKHWRIAQAEKVKVKVSDGK